jgi:hypothetical protein
MPYIPKSVIDHIQQTILPMKVEMCGYILLSDSGEVMLQTAASGKIDDVRANCVLPHLANYTWHSHFIGAKSYPSAEDILSVMKKRSNKLEQSELELIFTRWGIWNITSLYKDVFQDIHRELEYLTEKGNIIYHACKGAKTDFYDITAINDVISRIMNHYDKLVLNITFTPWTEIQGDYNY